MLLSLVRVMPVVVRAAIFLAPVGSCFILILTYTCARGVCPERDGYVRRRPNAAQAIVDSAVTSARAGLDWCREEGLATLQATPEIAWRSRIASREH